MAIDLRGLLGALQDPKNAPGLLNMSASLLAQGGYKPVPQTFGASLGKAFLNSQAMAQEAAARKLQEDYQRAQIEKMRAPDPAPVRKPVVVKGKDGNPIYVSEQDAIGMAPYLEPPGQNTAPSEIEIARALNDPNTPEPVKRDLRNLLDRKYRDPAAEPLIPVKVGDKTVLLPRSQAVGMEPGAQRESFVPTEGERTAANYYSRMVEAEKLLGAYVPSMKDYMAADQMMRGGPLRAGAANTVLSPEGQSYYQAAADWVRAKLRKESGAVIAPEEMAQEIKTYFPVPGDERNPQIIEQKRRARQQAVAGMKGMSGRAVTDPVPTPDAGGAGVDVSAIDAEIARRKRGGR